MYRVPPAWVTPYKVSMESGLEGRNNGTARLGPCTPLSDVSMESGLEGRNNTVAASTCRSS